ncbi:MAG: tRNA uridine 5-oxyacetic acid(34) methyltransferase CmoM, partial [Enterobacteriaceae bacterium]
EQHLTQPVDLILLHAVLEWLAEPQETLLLLQRCLRTGGMLSLLFYNKNGLLLRNVLLGNLAYVNAGMPKRKRRSLSPDHPLEPNLVYDWLMEMGMTITGKTGVRVFHDYLHDKQQRETSQLLALEQRYCRQEPFISLGRYIHVMACKPEQKDRV